MRPTLRERWEANVVRTDGCWLWTRHQVSGGYGSLSITRDGERKQIKAHRLAWEFYRGPVPEGMCVLHRCDVRNCVNPDHLFLGDVPANNLDMVQKGRQVHSERNGRAKLTREQVLAIRELVAQGHEKRALARQFGLNETTVGQIARGERWKRV